MADVYYVNNLYKFNKDVVNAYKNGEKEKLRELYSSASKTDYDIYICIDKNDLGFVFCAANIDKPDDPIGTAHFNILEGPENIPSQLFLNVFELKDDDEFPGKYKLIWSLTQLEKMKGQIKSSYFIGHIRNVSVIELMSAALDAAPKTRESLPVDNLAFVKRFCQEILNYSRNGQIQEMEFESQLNRLPDSCLAINTRNIWTQLFARIVDKFDGARFGAGGLFLVLVIMLIYPILVSWFLT